MVDQYLGEIKLVGFNFAPFGWAQCAGQILPLNQNTALFSLLGTMYGGNGTSTFALPDLQGRAAGNVGPNLYTAQGMPMGTEDVSIQITQYPAHSHNFNVHASAAASQVPTATSVLSTTAHPPSPPPAPLPPAIYTAAQGAPLQPLLNTGNLPVVGFAPGGSLPHENMMPFLTMNYVIALTGIFPARS